LLPAIGNFSNSILRRISLFPVHSTWDLIAKDILSDAGREPGQGQRFKFLRLIEHDDEVVATYEMTKPNGEKGRNTEILRIKDNKILSVEVYFGWDVLADH
jgi:hypothetical protein